MIALVLMGCSSKLEEQHAVVLEGFEYGWVRFNHRLSHLQVEPGDDHADVAVIGGTSTTGVVPPELPAECNPDGCQEFPVDDESEVEVRWAVVDSTEVALVTGSVDLLVGVDGASDTVEVPLPKGVGDAATAVISGLVLSTDETLAIGDACYLPAYGWHPRRIRVALGEVAVADEVATVEVSAAFEAGNTLEEERECVDEVNEQAQVALTVSFVVAAGGKDFAPEEAELHAEADFPWNGSNIEPEEQPDPAPQALALPAGADVVYGFSTIDFRLHPDDPDTRGAYLRTLGWWVEPDGTANAVATNWSPFTQLSAFSYGFDGVVRAIPTGGTVRRGTATAILPAELDGGAQPVVQEIAYDAPPPTR